MPYTTVSTAARCGPTSPGRPILLPEYELPDVDNRDLLLLIQLAVEKMPGQRQRIFRMSREEGIANDEIARRLGISTRTVENQISRALSELRKLVTLILFFF